MNEFTFWIPITGMGDNAQEAWEEAIGNLHTGILKEEYNKPPEDVFTKDDEIPSAEILGGSLSGGFGIDMGPEDLGEDAQRAADIDEMTRDAPEDDEK